MRSIEKKSTRRQFSPAARRKVSSAYCVLVDPLIAFLSAFLSTRLLTRVSNRNSRIGLGYGCVGRHDVLRHLGQRQRDLAVGIGQRAGIAVTIDLRHSARRTGVVDLKQ